MRYITAIEVLAGLLYVLVLTAPVIVNGSDYKLNTNIKSYDIIVER